MFSDVFPLDLHKNTILCYEPEKSLEAVMAIEEGIKYGDVFPAVVLYQIDKNTYSLVRSHYVKTTKGSIKDGGHTRSVAHYRRKVPLLVRIKYERNEIRPGFFDWDGTTEIPDIKVVSNLAEYLEKKILFPNYRHLDF